MNEFLSAVVAVRTLEPYLPLKDLIAIVACIEATIPFRVNNAAGRSPSEVLAERVREVRTTMGQPADEIEVDCVVKDATLLANKDVSSFSETDPAVFLSTTWLLIEESNAPLAAVGIYSVRDYRVALSRMEGFLGSLNPGSVFRDYNNTPDAGAHAALDAATARNLEFATRYLRMKIVSISVVEALAQATGGDCPVSMMLGDIRSNYGRPDRVEDFLPSPAIDDSLLDA